MAAIRTPRLVEGAGAGEGESGVREQPLQLGSEGHLVGVLAQPLAASAGAAPAPVPARPTFIFLNAGVIHRVGPHRLHVVIARCLAARGLSSLRLDLSGIGDSRAVPGAMSFRQSAVADTRSAMDELAASTGARRFVLFGLCSGADNALATASADDRVVGLVLVDPPAYTTSRARARKLLARVRRLGGVRRVASWGASMVARRVRARLGAARASAHHGAAEQPEQSGGRETPPLAAYRAQLTSLLDRRVAVFAVFSGALDDRYNDRDQIFEVLPELRGRIDRAYFPGANHTFTELSAQAELVTAVTAWADRL